MRLGKVFLRTHLVFVLSTLLVGDHPHSTGSCSHPCLGSPQGPKCLVIGDPVLNLRFRI